MPKTGEFLLSEFEQFGYIKITNLQKKNEEKENYVVKIVVLLLLLLGHLQR